mmetsp:Transcript_67803/g.189873  ORF Transcript_67803/g.189873 Transcript_67803/m.189873 type:complete len:259 (-) Transcript_67803:341-1117(-)
MTVRERVQTPHARNRNGRIPPHDASAVRLQQAAACAEPGGRSVGPGVLRGGLVQQAPECLPLVAAVLFLVLPRIVPLAVAAAPRVVLLPVVVLFPVVFLPIVVLLPVVLLPIVLVAPARRAAAAAAATHGHGLLERVSDARRRGPHAVAGAESGHRWVVHAGLCILLALLLQLHLLLLCVFAGLIDLALFDHLVQLLLVTVHLSVRLDLRQGDALAVAERDDLVEREHDVQRVLQDHLFVHLCLAAVLHNLREQAQSL